MSGPFGSSQWMYASGDFQIANSLRLDRSRDCSLSKTFASAGNRRTFTISLWIKSTETSTGYLFEGGDSDNDGSRAFLRLEDGAFRFAESAGQEFTTTSIRRDPSAWYHVVLAVDTTQGTNTNRIKFYINGEAQTFSTVNYPSQNHDYGINKAALHTIGRSHIDDNNPINAYFAEYNFIDGQQLTPASFGETDDTNGHWKPIQYGGTYGTNGFYLNFKGGGIIAANGGTITTDGDYKVHTFTSNGTFTPTSVSGDGFVEYLVIAGGGAGAADGATTAGNGGGGAGGYRTGLLAVTAQAYSITVGAGGVGALSASGVNGGNSVFSSITSTGGGGGGYFTSTPGSGGGSGGGGSAQTAAGGAGNTGGFSPPEGNAGETATNGQGGGGGGGAGEAGGTDGTGQGGDGLASSITGSSVTRAGGGGGSNNSTTRAGGAGGGGAGGNESAGGDGSTNTGSGGGAGIDGNDSGSGGSGIVIIRFKFQ